MVACQKSKEAPVSSLDMQRQCLASDGIINGDSVSPDADLAKSLVYIQTPTPEKNKALTCSGTLISPRVILTAAHCLTFEGLENLTAEEKAKKTMVLLSVDPQCTMKNRNVSKILIASKVIIHSGYNKKINENDIALIFLKADMPSWARTVPMATGEKILSGQDPVVVAGYGRKNENETSLNRDVRLTTTTLYLANDLTTNQRYKNFSGSPFLILDSERGTSVCNGDSGGPALTTDQQRMVVTGIASFVFDKDGKAPNCHSRVAYTSVAPYLSWIESMKKQESVK